MGYKGFRVSVLIRLLFISSSIAVIVYLVLFEKRYLSSSLIAIILGFQIYNLFYYVDNTNRKLSRFLESVKYSDFTSTYSRDDSLGKSFKTLNQSINKVLGAFRKTRAEKEEHLLYLNTVVQLVSVGLISFDKTGNVELYNNAAKQLLNVFQLRNIKELHQEHPMLVKILYELPTGSKTLFRKNSETQLTIHATELIMRGRIFKLVSIQNIQSELQQKETEAWQNLTRVLRHEIMNSMTPIASLTDTLYEILNEDLCLNEGRYIIDDEPVEDLREGLKTIKNRASGLIRFVDDYRNYTNIPTPRFKTVPLKGLFEDVTQLMKPNFTREGIQYNCDIEPPDLKIMADRELVEMVLINLLKNAFEAIKTTENATISLRGYLEADQKTMIAVTDNGPGIVPEALERIFIPFYTTKKGGSGIGLSLSRQIMQLHNGNLLATSKPDVQTVFILRF